MRIVLCVLRMVVSAASAPACCAGMRAHCAGLLVLLQICAGMHAHCAGLFVFLQAVLACVRMPCLGLAALITLQIVLMCTCT